ncbi:MAG: hypothetical protein ACTSVI_11960, partial [Promethearchaeota archaeon]
MIYKNKLFTVKNFLILIGSVLVLISLFFRWTKNRYYIEAINTFLPGGILLMITGLIFNLISLISSMHEKVSKINSIFYNIIGVSIITFIFLMFSSNYRDFFNQLDLGYFLNGVGCLSIIFGLIIYILALDQKNDASATKADFNNKSFKELEKQFYEALNHEIRRQIIRIIGANGFSTFTEFKNSFKIGTGTLYHHLKILSPLIFQDKGKKYYLNDLGMLTLRFMNDNAPY